MRYGLRLLECLIRSDATVWLLYSQVAQIVAHQELDLKLPVQPRQAQRHFAELYGARPGQLRVFGRDDWYAPPASGSSAPDALVVCPCSMGTLAAIAGGLSDNLIERAADVVLKERRTLVLVPRETPFSTLHLENMLRLSRNGAVILPANPGFYHRPESIEGLVDFVVARILDQIGIEQDLVGRWGEPGSGSDA
ncbi:MAG: UbiX family flavin prenyltransferase [Betaproteobacteria bacterium]|nr:UbiX family flavin prenyltransferase [Betaproteobacteria bacterium]